MAEAHTTASESCYEQILLVLQSDLVQTGLDLSDAYRALGAIYAIAWGILPPGPDAPRRLLAIRKVLGAFRADLGGPRRPQFDAEVATALTETNHAKEEPAV